VDLLGEVVVVEMSACEMNNRRMWLQGVNLHRSIPKFGIKELRLGCLLIWQCKHVVITCVVDKCGTYAIQ
jgi:hypothetical protein